MAVFALEQRAFLVKSPGSNPVLLFSPARLHFPSGSRNHLTSEEAFPAPWPAPRIDRTIGLWGQRHKRYLQEHKRAFYATLLTSGKLNAYLADVDKQAEKRFERLVEQMKQAQGITERLKAKNALEWVGQMNNIRACAMEIVEREIIFA